MKTAFEATPDSPLTSRQVETTAVGGKTYTLEGLRGYMERYPEQELPLGQVSGAVGPEHIYWIDREGNPLAPYQILQNWEEAQKVEPWADHVVSIRCADLAKPIWMTAAGVVFDGVHRLARAVLENRPVIKVRVATNLP